MTTKLLRPLALALSVAAAFAAPSASAEIVKIKASGANTVHGERQVYQHNMPHTRYA